ncbi:MAG: secretin and TonB N-terminal domain-containing protein [Candidatus Omnitrophota bacterium]
MKSKLLLFLGLVTLLSLPVSEAGEEADALKATEKAAPVYQEAQSAYWAGNYASASSLFSRVSAIDPNYNSLNVALYQNLASYHLRGEKSGVIKTYVEPKREQILKRDILINDEEEWLHLVGETEAVLQETSTYLAKVSASEKVSGEQLIDSWYYLKQARLAFERKEYLDTINYSHIAREKAEFVFEKVLEPGKTILGKVGDTMVTLNVTDLELKEALKQIYDLTGVNIVLSAGISGTVTMNVTNLPLRQILNLIVDTNGLKYTEKDNVITILTPEEYEKTAEGVALRGKKVYPLQYTEAQGIAKAIRDTMGIEAITADVRSNAIIIDATSAQQAQDVAQLIKELDMPVNQVLIEAELIEVTYQKDKSLGINFLIQSRMMDDVRITGPTFSSADSLDTLATGTDLLYFGLTHQDFQAIVSALSTEGTIHRLQSPRIMAISGSSSVISTKDTYPTIAATLTAATTTTPERVTYTVTETDVETTFEITPLIHNNRTISLNLGLVVERVREVISLPTFIAGITQDYPLVTTREASQNVILWDGQTLVVGGIVTTDTIKNEVRVPFLGNIPILGNLFKRTTLSTEDSELILFLTPHIVKSYEEGRTLTREAQASEAKKEPKKSIVDHPGF